jgi:two-component system chemotaxis response regulator CheB
MLPVPPGAEAAPQHVIVIGASAGGVDALRQLIPLLPANLPAAVFVAVHVLADRRSFLPELLNGGPLKALHATDGAPIESGKVYVAPPNRHLLVERGHMHLSTGPKENRHRPAINPLFRSAALAYGPNTVGVVLTGGLDDGTAGLWEIKRRGGVAVVQDPIEASYPEMPNSALANVPVDYMVRLEYLPSLLSTLAARPVAATAIASGNMKRDLTSITCPECRGPIYEHREGPIHEFRCRVGHAYAPEALEAAHAETIERTLWSGVVALEEGADMARKLRDLFPENARRLEQEEQTKSQMAARLKNMIHELVQAPAAEPA